MKFFSRTSRTSRIASKPRTVLSMTQLESREVPAAMLNLTTVGSDGAINGAIFQQYTANASNGSIQSFLRLDNNGREQGFNTNARPDQFDASGNKNLTHAIKVSDLPVANVSGTEYAQLVLDVNEPNWQPMISLDALQIFVSSNAKLNDYNAKKDTLGGLKAVYNMDAGADRWVKIDASLNNQLGTGDVVVDIPLSLLPSKDAKGNANYMFLYSQFGQHFGAGGKYEEWGTFPQQSTPPVSQPPASPPPAPAPTPTPAPAPSGPATISGVFLNPDGSIDGSSPDNTVSFFLADTTGNQVTDANGDYIDGTFGTVGADGSFNITTGTLDGAVTFDIMVSNGDTNGGRNEEYQITVNPGDADTGLHVTVTPFGG